MLRIASSLVLVIGLALAGSVTAGEIEFIKDDLAGALKKAAEEKKPLMVDVYATWCGPCKMLSPMLEKLAKDYSGKIKVVKVNVDEAQSLAGRFAVQGIPTLIFFKGGKMVDRTTGLLPEEALKSRLTALAQ